MVKGIIDYLTESKVIRVLSLVVATMSAVSFTQKIFSIGLSSMANSYIGFYRQISHSLFGLPAELIGIKIPVALTDFWVLSFICAGAYVRSKNIEKSRAFRNYNFKRPSVKLRVLIFFIAGFSGLALVVPLSATSISTYVRDDIMREALRNFVIVLIATVVFFIFNGFGPSA